VDSLLNKNQKRFKKEMEKIGQELAKKRGEKVYSYIERRYISNYYENNSVPSNYKKNKVQLKSPLLIFFKVIMYVVLSFTILIGVIAVAFGENPLYSLIFFLFILALILLIFGLINPVLVIYGARKTRPRVLGIYGSAILLFYILSVITTPKELTNNYGEGKIVPAVTTSNTEDLEQYKSEAIQIQYIDLARNPDIYKNKKVVFTGKVIHTIESGNYIALLVNVTKDEFNVWDDTIFVNYQKANGESRILENDIITFWGTVKGLKTYKSVLGSQVTIPEVDAKYITIIGNEK
jgi:ABC-type multidrug transport system fused ATPase/permease subunit